MNSATATSATTIFARASGLGHAAIGVLRISGADALTISNAILSRPLTRRDVRKMIYLEIRDPDHGHIVDDVLACYYAAPASYTGEDLVEIFCHGNPYILDNIESLYLNKGAVLADPGEFTRRAFVNGRMDLTQAEAVADIIESKGNAALSNARRLFDGALARHIELIQDRLLSIIAEFEAGIDFSDDIEDPINNEGVDVDLEYAIDQLDKLARSYDQGSRLSKLRVAILGEVNAGKSTLLNLMLGRERAIVSDHAGTTRDFIEAECVVGPYAFTLVDTAGARPLAQMQEIERKGYELGRAQIKTADLTVGVIDVSIDTLPEMILDTANIIIANKIDRCGDDKTQAVLSAIRQHKEKKKAAYTAVLTSLTSTPERASTDVRQAVQTHLDRLLNRSESVAITQKRQVDALRRCKDHLRELNNQRRQSQVPELLAEHVREALHCLGEITGERYTEQVLDTIFSRFCLGK